MKHYVCSWCDISFEELSILHLHMGIHIDFVGPKDDLSNGKRVHIDIVSPKGSLLNEVKNLPEDKKASNDKKEYQCKICDKYFNDLGMFSYHMVAHSEGKTYQCKICGWVFSVKSSVYNHMCNHINEKPCRCTGGHLAMQGKDNQPKIFESADDLFKCTVCDRGYCTKKNLYKHIHKHVGHYSCSICMRSYDNQAEYDKHMEHHDYVMFYRCGICFEAFDDRDRRDDHMKIHSSTHNGEMILCAKSSTFKDKDFINENVTSEEITSKKLKRNHVNKNCDVLAASQTAGSLLQEDLNSKKSSGLRGILKNIGVSHRRIAVESKNKDPLAGEKVTNTGEISSTDLNPISHERGNSVTAKENSAGEESRKYECKLCNSVWEDKIAFWQHLSEHSEKVPYTCKICVKIFSDVDSQRTHAEKKCKCALCGRPIIHRKDYSFHTKVCPVGKPFKCRVCIKRFPSSDVFREHMESHSREKSCRCKICGEVLLFKYEADRHKVMHREDGIDPCSIMLLSEGEDDSIPATTKSENLLCTSDKEDVIVPSSSIKLENVDSSDLDTLIVIKEEPFPEDRKGFHATAFTAIVEQSNVIIVNNEAIMKMEDSALDPLA